MAGNLGEIFPDPAQNDATGDGDTLVDSLRLSMVSGVGPRIRRALLDRFGSSRAVLTAAASQIREVQGVGPKLTRSIVAASDEVHAEDEIELCRKHDIAIVTEADPA